MAMAADKALARAVVARGRGGRPGRAGAARRTSARRSPRRRWSSRWTRTTRWASTLVRDPADFDAALAARPRPLRPPCWSRSTSSWAGRCAAASLDRDGELVCLPLEEYAVDPATKPIRGHGDKIGARRRRRARADGQGREPRPGSSTPTTRWTAAGAGRGPGLPRRAGLPRTTACSTSGSTPTGGRGSWRPASYCSFATASVVVDDGRGGGDRAARAVRHGRRPGDRRLSGRYPRFPLVVGAGRRPGTPSASASRSSSAQIRR